MTELLKAERLRGLLHYDPENGLFTWLVSTSNRVKVGDVAGSFGRRGYAVVGVDGREYKAHRLAVLWMTGEWPENEVDHVDRSHANNRWANLREATRSQNMRNQSRRSDSKSGVLGVCWHETGKWHARIQLHGRSHYIGLFASIEAAAKARRAAELKLFEEFAPERREGVAHVDTR